MAEAGQERREHAHQLHELTQHPGWVILTREAEKKIHALQRRLIDGKAADYAEYRDWAAHAAGMLEVFDIPERVQRAAEE